ncbi:MarR family winged helix-turn-helix transcriptional regulator [Seonamhaeicola marinus]|uniref:MarR family transcriptional regulator n=1 Tax=Seonamhaeicola marinus TaxID=1912246 RepID=A0A5D0J752_9FLAO|nr:MarR family transcriptional regulator [Seonamhaeicola marinus]TYA92195.1 MarR family transcriptional regulator [Seonamhaeicola marinus]
MTEKNLYYLIELTARKIRHYGQTILNEHGLNLSIEQWLVLKTVSENEGINQIKIGELLIKDKPTISRMIKNLVNQEYIVKRNDTKDLRQYAIYLTPKGNELLKRLLPIIEDIRLKGLNNLTEDEQLAANSILLKIQNNLFE